MEKLTVKELAVYILEFVEAVAPQLACCLTYDTEGEPEITYLSVNDTLAMWSQIGDCAYSSMFMGWLMAKGISPKASNPYLVEKAVFLALTGHENNIINFSDYYGADDATQKLN
jgi:hypothetical protein